MTSSLIASGSHLLVKSFLLKAPTDSQAFEAYQRFDQASMSLRRIGVFPLECAKVYNQSNISSQNNLFTKSLHSYPAGYGVLEMSDTPYWEGIKKARGARDYMDGFDLDISSIKVLSHYILYIVNGRIFVFEHVNKRSFGLFTTPNPYSAVTQFRGVTDWYQEPSPFCRFARYQISGVVDHHVCKGPMPYVVAAFHAPSSPDYVPGPKYPPSLDFVPEPVYPEFMPPADEVLLIEEKPLPTAASPTADSPGYVPESDPEEDPEEDDDEDPEEDPANYLVDGGDDGDDEDESSDDDEDDDVDIEGVKRRRRTQLLSTLQMLLYQLLIRPHLLRRLGHTVMLDSEDSTITYADVSSPFADLPDIGSPRVDRPPVMPEDPYAYVPLPVAASPTADSPGYVPKLDPEEDTKEDDDEDPEEDPVDYPANEGDDGDDEDESSDDYEADDVNIKGDKEEEEHPAPADSTTIALPAVDHAPSVEETEPFETDESAATPPPHPAYRVARLLAIPTPPPSQLSLWSSPLPQIPSLPLPPILSPPLPISYPPPVSPIRLLGYQAAMIRLRAEAPSTSHSLPLPPPIILSHTRSDAPSSGTPPLSPIQLPTSSPPLHLLSTNHRADRPEVTLPPRKREIMQDLERDVGYGIIETWDKMLVDMPGAPTTDDTELGRRMTEFTTRVRQDTDEIYTRLDDE
ncbi:hypothetical protein Tco_0972919 [Tanacetum coccineum]